MSARPTPGPGTVAALELIAAAKALVGKFPLRDDCAAGSVASALRTGGGRIHTGICLELECGIGTCAEHAAVAEMLKHRETDVACIVAVGADGVLPPCGRCRELIAQVSARGLDTEVVLAPDRVVPLRDLLPSHWLPEP